MAEETGEPGENYQSDAGHCEFNYHTITTTLTPGNFYQKRVLEMMDDFLCSVLQIIVCPFSFGNYNVCPSTYGHWSLLFFSFFLNL